MKNIMRRLFLFSALLLLMQGPSYAIPELQIYIEGSEYDAADESWITDEMNFVLWAIGDIGSYGTIYDVQLAVAYDIEESGSISITPTTTALLTDPSTPQAVDFLLHGDETIPLTGDGSPLAPHGIYGTGTSWDTYELGNFSLTDSPVGDFCYEYPSVFPSLGQINAYQVDVSGYSWVHFDLFDHVIAGNSGTFKYVNAPYSHDAGSVVPEPATLILLGSGLLGLAALRKKRG